VVLELEVADLVDEQRLERGVEERGRLEPLEVPRELVLVDEQAGKEEAAGARSRGQLFTATAG